MTYSNLQEKGRPIKIYDEDIPLTSNAKSINFKGAGVSGTVLADEVIEDIPGVSMSSSEVPLSGSIDGVNKVFTFTHYPGMLTLNGAVQALIISGDGDFTISGSSSPYTVTFIFPPQSDSILRNYY